MSCRIAREQLSAYVDDALEPSARASLEAHLQRCAACAEETASLRQMVESLHGLGSVKAPRDLLTGVRQKLQRQPAQHQWFAWEMVLMPQRALALGLTAVVVAVVVAVPVALRARRQPSLKILASAPPPARANALLEQQVFPEHQKRRFRAVSPDEEEIVARNEHAALFDGKASVDGNAPTADAPQVLVQMQWVVANRQAATTALQAWADRTPGVTLTLEEERVVLQLPAVLYANFLDELAGYGTVTNDSDSSANSFAKSSAELGTPLTVELSIVSPAP